MHGSVYACMCKNFEAQNNYQIIIIINQFYLMTGYVKAMWQKATHKAMCLYIGKPSAKQSNNNKTTLLATKQNTEYKNKTYNI